MSRKVRHFLILLVAAGILGGLYWWGERAVTALRFGAIEAVVEACREEHGVGVAEVRRDIENGRFQPLADAAAAGAPTAGPFYRCLVRNADFDAEYFVVYARVRDPFPWGPSHR